MYTSFQTLAQQMADMRSLLMSQLQTMQTDIQTLKSDVYRKHHKKVSIYRPTIKHEHLQLKWEVLGSIPCGYPGFFPLPAGLLMLMR